jgi:alkanesulfonate monooxygenase SsuD/methylene tetrahydromethanopterin reductase-like flavin-dependent oxidoreductase (luciferase family)
VQQPRTPFVMAANGPRSLRLAARHGAGWVTTGPRVDTLEEWWTALKGLSARLDDALAAQGRNAAAFERHLNLDSSPVYSLSSVDAFEEMTGRAGELGFTDVIAHWPRPQDPYAGSVATLERVAAQVLPRWR